MIGRILLIIIYKFKAYSIVSFQEKNEANVPCTSRTLPLFSGMNQNILKKMSGFVKFFPPFFFISLLLVTCVMIGRKQ